jgi:uncharacterized membrane protein YfcA
MHHGADDEPAHPVLVALNMVFGAIFGVVFGVGGFFVATALPLMLRTALPAMPDTVSLALWTICIAVLLIAFARAYRRGRDDGARAFAACGIAALTILFAGELTGTITVFPWHTRFYIVPGPLERPPY